MKNLKGLLTTKSIPFYVEQEEIEKTHPMRTDRHDLYGAAHVMVSERYEKAELIGLVNYLLHQIHNIKK